MYNFVEVSGDYSQAWGFCVLYNVYITNQFQTTFVQGRVIFVTRGECEKQRRKTLKTFVPITSKNSGSGQPGRPFPFFPSNSKISSCYQPGQTKRRAASKVYVWLSMNVHYHCVYICTVLELFYALKYVWNVRSILYLWLILLLQITSDTVKIKKK